MQDCGRFQYQIEKLTHPKIDADTLDGLDSLAFLKADGSVNLTGNLQWDGSNEAQFAGTANRLFAIDANTFRIDAGTNAGFAIGGVTQIELINGVLHPTADDDIDLGRAVTNWFKNAHLKGALYFNSTAISIAADASGDLLFDVAVFDNYKFNVDSAIEVTIVADQMTFNNGTTDTSLNWSTDGELDVVVGFFTPLTITATGIEPSIDGGTDVGSGSKQFGKGFFDDVIASTYVGGAPLVIADNTVIANLNASLLEGNAASAFLTAVPTGTMLFDGIDDTPTALTVSTDPVMALVLTTTTGVTAVLYEAWGYMTGGDNTETGWTIAAEDPDNVVLATVLVKQDATGTGDSWNVPFYICGYDAGPGTGATGYHLDIDETFNGSTLHIVQTRLTRIAA